MSPSSNQPRSPKKPLTLSPHAWSPWSIPTCRTNPNLRRPERCSTSRWSCGSCPAAQYSHTRIRARRRVTGSAPAPSSELCYVKLCEAVALLINFTCCYVPVVHELSNYHKLWICDVAYQFISCYVFYHNISTRYPIPDGYPMDTGTGTISRSIGLVGMDSC
jgi:hypothetical protein